MSASDLVPRVVLLVTDLKQENDELKSQMKEQEDKQLLVQITGPNRTPIHYEGSLKNGFSNGAVDSLWQLDFEDNHNGVVHRHQHLPLSAFPKIEVWVGGIFIENFQERGTLYNDGFSLDDPKNLEGTGTGVGKLFFLPRRGEIGPGETGRGNSPVHAIFASIGPLTYVDYLTNMLYNPLDIEE